MLTKTDLAVIKRESDHELIVRIELLVKKLLEMLIQETESNKSEAQDG